MGLARIEPGSADEKWRISADTITVASACCTCVPGVLPLLPHDGALALRPWLDRNGQAAAGAAAASRMLGGETVQNLGGPTLLGGTAGGPTARRRPDPRGGGPSPPGG